MQGESRSSWGLATKTSSRSLQYDIGPGQADGALSATPPCAVTVPIAAARTAMTIAPGAAAPLLARARFIHVQAAAVDILAGQLGNRAIGSRVVVHFDEAKAAGLAGRAIGHKIDAIDLPVGGEHALHLLFGRMERQVSYV
jgi:hypothetical protein